MYRFLLMAPPKGKIEFRPITTTSSDGDSDSEDETPITMAELTANEDRDNSIKLCKKSLKHAQAAAGLHYVNPDITRRLPLNGLSKDSPNLFLEICPVQGNSSRDTSKDICNIYLCQDQESVLTVQFKIHRDPQGHPSKLTLEAVKTARKTVSVPEDVLTLQFYEHYCLCIHKGNKSTKVLVNSKEVALIEDPFRDQPKPVDLVVTEGIAVKSVDIPMRFVPSIVKAPFKGNMEVGDRINVFGERQMDCEQETALLTLGDLVVPYNKDSKTGQTRIIIQRFQKCLVAFENGKAVVTCRTPEKFNTAADLIIKTVLNPKGIWITRMKDR
ncbi:uncharacterized protein LOC135383592 isoform X1 [Ornithodoros turicata]|uniref:uncharacterized protein LOC135383592 isoform X1 n=1 Tax=Ornithodoros turicata TaxID=34597 RepID=UPI0031392F8D